MANVNDALVTPPVRRSAPILDGFCNAPRPGSEHCVCGLWPGHSVCGHRCTLCDEWWDDDDC